jgi:hypothetical protein
VTLTRFNGSSEFVVFSNKEKAARAGLLRQRTPLLKCEMDDFLGKTCLNAALRWFLGGSTQWLSTVSAGEPQIRARICPDAALKSYHRQKKRSVSLLTQPPSLAHVALEVERKRQKSPAMYLTILSIRIKREI